VGGDLRALEAAKAPVGVARNAVDSGEAQNLGRASRKGKHGAVRALTRLDGRKD
jgi:hypothetical protein